MLTFILISLQVLPLQAKDSMKNGSLKDWQVTITAEQTQLRQVLKKIERQTKLKFFYNDNTVDVERKVSLNAKGTLEDVLRALFSGTSVQYRLSGKQILLVAKKVADATNGNRSDTPDNTRTERDAQQVLNAQQKIAAFTVSGRVMGESNMPLPGVNVLEKGTTNGTSTDSEGKYTLTLENENAVLIFSFIGYLTEEVPVSGRNQIDVLLAPDIKSLDEVVVIGYGTQRKQELTSSITPLTNKEVNELPVASIGQALQGRVPGLTVTNVSSPGTPPDIRIRGVSSVSFATDPLYVIDGFPTTNLSNFDSKDVESVEILKDASAAAIYGSRATNGVILITTRSGAKNSGMKVTLDTYVGVESPWRKLDPMNTAQRSMFMDAMFAGDNIDDASKRPSRYTPQEMNKPAYPGASQTYARTNTDWQNLYFKNGLITNTNVSLSGGGEHSRFYSSGGYMKQDGIVEGVGFERYNFRINSAHDIGKNFTFGQNLLISYSSQRYNLSDGTTGDQGTPLSLLQFALPHIPVRDPITGNWLKAAGDAIDGHPFPNPVAEIENSKTYRKTTKLLGTAYLDIRLTPWLKFKSTVGLDYADALNSDICSSYTVNDGQNILRTNNGLTPIANNRNAYASLLFSQQITFDKTFAEDHHVNAILVYENQSATTREELMSGKQSSDGLNTLDGASEISATNRLEENLLVSYVSRVTYSYKSKYLLNASIRRDGSSVWAPGNKFASFPAVSAGWSIDREPFMSNSRTFSELKLRASYGITGLNPTALSNYPWQSLVHNSAYPFNNNTQVNTAFYNKLANANLKWEKTNQINIGIDAGFLSDRITVTAEYFDRVTDNLILKSSTPPSFGYIQATDVNIGKMQNKGWELAVGYNGRNEGNFKWGVSGNVNVVRNKVLRLDAPSGVIYGGEGNYFSSWGMPVTRTKAGEPIQSFYGWVIDHIYQTQGEVDADNQNAKERTNNPDAFYQSLATAPGDIRFKDLNGDGVVDDKDRQVIGSFLPDFTYGLNFTASYKNFDLSVLFQGVQGGDIYSGIGVYAGAFRWPIGGSLSAFENAWTADRPSTTHPRIRWSDPNDNSRISSRWLQDASYVRLKNINIGYQIPAGTLSKYFKGTISRFRMYLASQNLLTLTRYTLGYDPEIGAKIGSNRGRGNLTNGIDYGQYPAARSVIFGLQLGF